MNLLRAIVLLVVLVVVGAALFVYAGVYDFAADVPHTSLVYNLLQTARVRSIAAHARGIAVPPLDDDQRVAEGAEHYAAMCAGCHLAPGKPDTEIRRGLYPAPPKLAEAPPLPPAQAFWVIKHGIKMTAMPAWGTSHDDEAIWNLVAFVQKLPAMTPEQYAALTATAAHEHGDHDHGDHEHEHGHDDAVPAGEGAEPAQEHDRR